MSCDAVDKAMAKLKTAGIIEQNLLEGCSTNDIDVIESTFQVLLPERYRHFLELMGRNPDDFMSGTDITYPELLGFRNQAIKLLHVNRANFDLPKNALVILFHGGYNFAFLYCNVSDDPPVYLYEEGDAEPHEVADSFSTWLLGLADGNISIAERLREKSFDLRKLTPNWCAGQADVAD